MFDFLVITEKTVIMSHTRCPYFGAIEIGGKYWHKKNSISPKFIIPFDLFVRQFLYNRLFSWCTKLWTSSSYLTREYYIDVFWYLRRPRRYMEIISFFCRLYARKICRGSEQLFAEMKIIRSHGHFIRPYRRSVRTDNHSWERTIIRYHR